ncbi:MAG: GNAT family N-acetyltransferase [Erysipelotrichaceae bacterium]|nr:GNAT family N-acetyltransferase [Erysipelotrichaceae bacterium]
MKLLETSRLYLRTFENNDAYRMSDYRSKAEVAKYQSWDTFSVTDAYRRISTSKDISSLNKVKSNYQLAICLKENDLLIGDVFVEVFTRKIFVLGYTIDSDYWGLGYASEIIEAFCKYMKKTYKFRKVLCYVYSDNQRSIHLLHKLGFKRISKSKYFGDETYIKFIR